MKEKIKEYIQTWEARCYFDGIPDEAPHELEIRNKVPSYRLIAFAILKNDVSLKTLGYSPTKSKWYDYYKRIEIQGRQKYIQLKLDL
jgi:predicted phosphoadenosine phosphosulfate sulfurtransferase